uniref:[RNA-polymerase]-subunit kinase n=1 Tax=Oryza brachyantha TaxID=4533 RepID=J3N0P0_ORYBR
MRSSILPSAAAFGSIHDYERLDVIGGAFGVVYEARDRRTGEKVALKWIRRHGVDMREVRCQAACSGHPSIVEILDVVQDAELGYMHVPRHGARRRRQPLLISGPSSEDATRGMMRQLLAAAKAVHAAGIIHRDIKPDNVVVGSAGELKLCDFGAATQVKPSGQPYEQSLVGTLTYASPEQLAGNRHYGPAVDMWALGCVMGELLTGAPLFEDFDTDVEDLLAEVLDRLSTSTTGACKLFDSMPELSPAGREVLAGLLALNPDERLTAEALEHRWFT